MEKRIDSSQEKLIDSSTGKENRFIIEKENRFIDRTMCLELHSFMNYLVPESTNRLSIEWLISTDRRRSADRC